MNWRQRALVFTFLVVFATTAWTQCASAAIILSPSELPASAGVGAGGSTVPGGLVDLFLTFLGRDQGRPIAVDCLFTYGGANAPSSTSSVASASAVAVVATEIWADPSTLVTRLVASVDLFFPNPAPCCLLRPPRSA